MCEHSVFHENIDGKIYESPEVPALRNFQKDAPLVMAVSENQRGEIVTTAQAHQLTTGGGKPGQGYAAVLTSSAAGSRAKTLASPESGLGFLAPDPASSGSLPESLARYGPRGSSSRMFPDSLAQTEGAILRSSLARWMNSGMGGPTGYSTLDSSESPRGGVASTLSDILADASTIPPRYYLSARAAAGILRRVARRGKMLPTRLAQALDALARGTESATPGIAPTSPTRSGRSRTAATAKTARPTSPKSRQPSRRSGAKAAEARAATKRRTSSPEPSQVRKRTTATRGPSQTTT